VRIADGVAYTYLVPALLMLSLVGLTLFNLLVLLRPPQALIVILELMPLPSSARTTLFGLVVINTIFSVMFERWGTGLITRLISALALLRKKRRHRDGKMYKAVEGGMR
jgi:cation-transporting P-type ATPase 13A2